MNAPLSPAARAELAAVADTAVADAATAPARAGTDQLVFENAQVRVIRRRLADGQRVLIKRVLGADALLRLRTERRVLERVVGLPGVPQLLADAGLAGVQAGDEHAIVLHDVALPRLSPQAPAPMAGARLLAVASRLAHILAALHRRGVQHRNIHPGNLALAADGDAAARTLMLVGFEHATTSAEEQPGFTHHSLLAAALAYAAPEQSGRSGQAVDGRADLYAVGATLYALATGRPPFVDADPLRLIHQHLATLPEAPHTRVPDLPDGLSAVIMKLLEKSPDSRYQSAQGLALDLDALRARFAAPQDAAAAPPAAFVPGLRDFPERLAAPSRLAGRERETAALDAAFSAALHTDGRAVLVAGAPGVGKTVLVNTLRPRVTAQRGWYVAGKFDQLRQDRDTDAVHQALRALGRLLLAEPEAELHAQRQRLHQALGASAGLVAATLPEFALLLGLPADAAASTAGGADVLLAETQWVQAVLALLRAIVSPQRPLVMLVDDLQWAAAPAVRILDAIVAETGSAAAGEATGAATAAGTAEAADAPGGSASGLAGLAGLLLIGAYRANEVDATHPLQARIERWRQLPRAPETLVLDNLPPAGLGALLGDMLRLAPEPAAALAGAVGARTGGNPFDTVELVNALRRDGVLVPGAGGWQWRAEDIARHVGQTEVVPLLQARIAALPPHSQALLDALACLGGEVALDLLQAATGLSAEVAEAHAVPALDAGLLLLRVHDGRPGLRFRHDRVQQAAYLRLGEQGAARLHLALARRLAAFGDDPARQAQAAEQYLPAVALIPAGAVAERRLAAQLCHDAAVRLRLVSHGMAERFTGAGLALLDGLEDQAGGAGAGSNTGGRAADQALHAALATERHRALYNQGRLDLADDTWQRIDASAPAPLQRVPAACLQIASLTHRGRGPDAVALGLALLRALGTEVTADDPVALEQGLDELVLAGRHDLTAADLSRPEAQDPRVVAVADLLERLVIPSLQCNPAVNAWLAVESRRLWTAHGACAALVRAAALCVPLVLVSRRQAYREAHALARQALAVGEARGYSVATATARHVYAIATQHWYGALEDSVAQAHQAHEALLRGGDLQFACLTFHATAPALFDSAPTLLACAGEVDAGLAFARRTGNAFAQGLYANYRQLLRCLREPQRDGADATLPGSFGDAGYDEAQRHAGPLSVGTQGAVYRVLRALSAALFDDAPALQQHVAAALPLLGAIPGFHPVAWAQALHALAMAQRLRAWRAQTAQASPDETREALAALDAALVWLTRRADDQPANYRALQHWIAAERAWALGDEAQAVRAFDTAMNEAAPQAGRCRPWQRALITERAGLCRLALGLPAASQLLLAEALRLYDAWGATAKVSQMLARHPLLRDAWQAPAAAHGPASAAPATLAAPGALPAASATLDLMAVVRASQMLSSETSLARLTARVVTLLGEMTGATGVQLLLRTEAPAGWQLLHAEADGGQDLPLEDAGAQGRLPLTAVRYAERTQQPLVVDDAVRDDRFAADPYFNALPHCALLVLPIVHQGQLRALLLLENRLAAGSFAAHRLDGVQLVAAQLAVSLENARLYGELEARVAQRTAELREAQTRLVDTARRAGMAEIATNVLHNVGNVLNSVNVSADLIAGRLRGSKASGLGRAVALMQQHQADLGQFFMHDEKGQRLPGYLDKLAQALTAEQAEMAAELAQLTQRVAHIKDIVATQQSFAGNATVREAVQVDALVRDALQMTEASLARHQVRLHTQVPPLPALRLDRTRLLQILVNLLSNAKQACQAAALDDPCIHFSVARQGGELTFEVSDNGVGIAPENLARVFAHGFTTRQDGHGFGLHSCVLAAQEMGGSITAHSDGPGRGARFVLTLPADAA